MLCLKLDETNEAVIQLSDGREVVVRWLWTSHGMRVGIEAPKEVKITRRPATKKEAAK